MASLTEAFLAASQEMCCAGGIQRGCGPDARAHGCIRLTNWDVLELAAIVRPGTPATLKD